MPSERLQKIIAAAGIASRRSAEKLIAGGLVEVNGKIVSELGSKADLEHDHIRVNGKLLHAAEPLVYLLMNKPKGYVTTVSDPERRPTVMDLLRGVRARVYPVGRLDYASEGLLLLTNDGELANLLMKAASHVPKTYLVKIAGTPVENGLDKLRRGITILNDRGQRVRTAPAQISSIRDAENPWYEVTLTEGKNRQIRKMFEEIGHHVEKIKRVRYGPMTLDVHPGEFRHLTAGEVEKLRAATRAPRPGAVAVATKFPSRVFDRRERAKTSSRTERPKAFNRKGRKEDPQRPQRKSGAGVSGDLSPGPLSTKQRPPKHRSAGQSSSGRGSSARRGSGAHKGERRS
jgi:23S rRNA pseudouridine2605 synthase